MVAMCWFASSKYCESTSPACQCCFKLSISSHILYLFSSGPGCMLLAYLYCNQFSMLYCRSRTAKICCQCWGCCDCELGTTLGRFMKTMDLINLNIVTLNKCVMLISLFLNEISYIAVCRVIHGYTCTFPKCLPFVLVIFGKFPTSKL